MCLNRKLLPLTAAVLCTVLLFSSCTQKTTDSPAERYTIESIEDVPAFEEFSQLPISEKMKIKMGIENIEIDSCDAHYTNFIKEFLKDEELVRFRDIEIERDDLSLIQGRNSKSLLNVVLTIDLEMDTTQVIDNCEIAEDVSYRLMNALNSDTFYALKVRHIIISTYDLNGYLVRTSDKWTSINNETVFLEQPEEEYAAQTVAYNFGKRNPNFALNKFGAIPDTRELYVEYYVEDGYFGRGAAENQRSIEKLETVRDTIEKFLMGEDATGQYIAANDLKILTISFRNGIFEDSCLTFNAEL